MNNAATQRSSVLRLTSWELILIQLILFVVLVLVLEKPTGSISGRIAVELPQLHLMSFDFQKNKAYVLATSTKEGENNERGVWVNSDGTFKINRLPVGEYSLRVKAPGFSSGNQYGLYVEDGQDTKLKETMVLNLEHPSLNLAAQSRVFTGQEQPRFWINASGANRVQVKIYQRNMLPQLMHSPDGKGTLEVSTDLSIYKPYGEQQDNLKKIIGNARSLAAWDRKLTPDRQDWSHEEFRLDKPLPKGDYLVTGEAYSISGEKDWNVFWFSVSDLGLIVKQDLNQAVVRAINLQTLKPMAGVKISLFDRNRGTYYALPKEHSVTGSDGLLNISYTVPASSTNLLIAGTKGDDHAWGGLSSAYTSGDSPYRTYFYTERPVYRLGQTVYFKAICRKNTEDGLKNPGEGLPVTVSIEDPDGQKVWQSNTKTTKFGSFDGFYALPEEAKIGGYSVQMTYKNGHIDYASFEVAQYRKPEYKVTVLPLKSRYIAGQKVKARIRAEYFFGAPVANAQIKYTVYQTPNWNLRWKLQDRPEYYSYFDDWEDSDTYYWSGDSYLLEGKAVTDDSGECIVEFDTAAPPPFSDITDYDGYRDKVLRIDVEATDISRLTVSGAGSVELTSGSFALFCQPDQYVAKAGETLSASVNTLTYEGQPQPNIYCEVMLVRNFWRNSEAKQEIVEQTYVTTDKEGKACAKFKTKKSLPSYDYSIIARARDNQGRSLADSSSIWIASENYPYTGSDTKPQVVNIKLDKLVYKPGEKAKAVITAPVKGTEGLQALVSVEGLKLYSYKLIDLKSPAQLIELPVIDEYTPNAYVSVVFVGPKHQYYTASQILRVSPQTRFLKLAVDTDKSRYKPGEQATYTIKASYDDGKPAADCELSLGIVDEAVYSIRPEYTRDIRKFFYNERPNQVTTICSFPEEYSGGPSKLEPRIRKDFRDTAAWIPHLVTDANGLAHAQIKMPDNLTTWRATVRGIDLRSYVGSAINKVVATQDIIVRLALPRFFTCGDEGLITAIVHNYSNEKQNIQVNLTPSGQFSLNSKTSTTLFVEPDRAQRFSWPVKITSPGEATVAIQAIGQTEGDAMEIKLPILPLGTPVTQIATAYTKDDSATIDIPCALPANAVPGSAKLSLTLSSSSLGPVLASFDKLIDYPYGCTEQTMSRITPSAIAMRLKKALDLPVSAKLDKKFRDIYDQGMRKLDSYQHSNGGWGWWQNDESSPYMTALVLDGYKLLRQCELPIEETRLKRGLDYLADALSRGTKILQKQNLIKKDESYGDTLVDLCAAASAMAEHGRALPADFEQWVFVNRKDIPTEGLAYLTLACTNTGKKSTALPYINELLSRANDNKQNSPRLISWDAATSNDNNKSWMRSYRFTDTETAALCLRALLAASPDKGEEIQAVKAWLLLQQDQNGWGNTKTTAQVIRAFTDDTTCIKLERDPDYLITGNEAESVFSPLSFNKENMLSAYKKVDLSPAAINNKTNIRLKKTGAGTLYYTATLSYYLKMEPGQAAPVPNRPNGLTMERQFFRLLPKGDPAKGNLRFVPTLIPDGKIKCGETVLMRLKINSPTRVPYVLLQGSLPSGAEVIENSPQADNTEETEANSVVVDSGACWWSRQDTFDDHVAMFIRDLPSGKSETHTLLRMELPGVVMANPARLQGMYTNAVEGLSSCQKLEIKE